MNNQELIVPFNKESTKTGLAVCFFFVSALLYLLDMSFKLCNKFGHYITFFIQSILMINIILFALGFIYGFFQNKSPDPAARLNKDGIWIKHFGLVSWPEIDEFKEYIYPGVPISGIAIRVKNLNRIFFQASIIGKLGVFWSKVFGYPPIIIANIEIENQQIMEFAQRFLIQEEQS